MYWIQPPNETAPAETYCDMSFAGGGWTLASHGYDHTTGLNAKNNAIPNMNNPFGYSWRPNRRSSSNGLINLPDGAVKIANNPSYLIMAAGNNPATVGIDQYAYIYTWIFKTRVSKNINSFYYLAIYNKTKLTQRPIKSLYMTSGRTLMVPRSISTSPNLKWRKF